jgi:hypothetical protein
LFWDSQRPIAEHYHDRGTTVNSAYYSEMCYKLRQQMLRTTVKRGLLHNNALHMLLSTWLKPSGSCTLSYWNTLHIALMKHLWTLATWIHWEML